MEPIGTLILLGVEYPVTEIEEFTLTARPAFKLTLEGKLTDRNLSKIYGTLVRGSDREPVSFDARHSENRITVRPFY